MSDLCSKSFKENGIMKNAKKIMTVLLSCAIAVLSTACTGSQSGSESSQSEGSQSDASQEESSRQSAAADKPMLEKISEKSYDFGTAFTNGYALVAEGWKVGYINTKGEYFPAYDLTSCTQKVKQAVNNIVADGKVFVSEEGYFPYYDVKSNKWGYNNIVTGEVIVEPKYEHCGPFASGCAVGIVDGKFEVIDNKGNVIATPAKVFDGYYQKDRLLVSMNSRKDDLGFSNMSIAGYVGALLDNKGNAIMENQFCIQESGEYNANGFEIAHAPRLYQGDDNTMPSPYPNLAVNEQPGIYDLNGNFLHNQGTATSDSSEGITAMVLPNEHMSTDGNGPLIAYIRVGETEPFTDFLYTSSALFSEGRCWVRKEGNSLFGLIDNTGKEVMPPSVGNANEFKKGYALAMFPVEGQEGYIRIVDRDGKFVTEENVHVQNYVPNAQLMAIKHSDTDCSITDMEGNEIMRGDYVLRYDAEEGDNIVGIMHDENGNSKYSYYRYKAK